jgi:serine/threonine protein kinase
MGEVYLAARADDQYQKQVAIKLVRRGWDLDSIIRRFRQERQILANLDHANIARMIDGGITGDGLPWIALEYVDGEPIDLYCNKNQLSITDRLKLFRGVCEAVNYAHRNLVVHRDIKPSNIMVTADGTSKLLDFGIAKILSPQLGEQYVDYPSAIMRTMTPAYASPEQVQGESVSTASDVYSLGIIMYELLAGNRPYQVTSSMQPREIERVVCDEEPVKPSLMVARNESTDGQPQTGISPGTVKRRLRRQLRGDLDNIILKALQKDPQRRYTSAEQLSEDIKRYLDGWPVTATENTLLYRSFKFAGRNKSLVAISALAVLLLVSLTIYAFLQAAAAQRESANAQTVSGFAGRIFSFADPNHDGRGHGKGPDITLVEAIRELEKKTFTDFSDKPDVAIELHHRLGQLWYIRGEFDAAEPHLRAAMELTRSQHGETHPRAIQNLFKLSLIAQRRRGDNTRAIEMIRRSVEMMRLHEPGNGALPYMLSDLGEILGFEGNYDEAEKLLLEAHEMLRKIKGNEDNLPTALISTRLGEIYMGKSEIERAEAHLRENLERFGRFTKVYQEPAEPAYLLGIINYLKGNYSQAERSLVEAETLSNYYLGRDYPKIAEILSYLSSLHCDQKNTPLQNPKPGERWRSTGVIDLIIRSPSPRWDY